MITKTLKMGGIALVGAGLVGGLFFGGDLVSYARSSFKSVQTSVKDNVPIEFELKRARDLLEEVIPEMHANIKLISQEEVEIAALQADIETSQEALDQERARITKLRKAMTIQKANYTFGKRRYTRDDVKHELSNRFARFKEAELVITSKHHLLSNRERSLQAALQLLDDTRAQKRLLEEKISALEGQYRLQKAASVGSEINIDNSKLAKTEKLISDIKKRLDVHERVLAHESRFVQTIPVDPLDEGDLLAQIDEHFCPTHTPEESIEGNVKGITVVVETQP